LEGTCLPSATHSISLGEELYSDNAGIDWRLMAKFLGDRLRSVGFPVIFPDNESTFEEPGVRAGLYFAHGYGKKKQLDKEIHRR